MVFPNGSVNSGSVQFSLIVLLVAFTEMLSGILLARGGWISGLEMRNGVTGYNLMLIT